MVNQLGVTVRTSISRFNNKQINLDMLLDKNDDFRKCMPPARCLQERIRHVMMLVKSGFKQRECIEFASLPFQPARSKSQLVHCKASVTHV